MGPSNRKREKSAPPITSRMDAVRSLLRTPPSPSSTGASPPPPQAEWSSPSFTRARARPSNLHSYLRSSPSFPLSHNQHQQNNHHSSNSNTRPSSSGGRSNASSGSGSEWRSQRTQATQTPEKAHNRRASDNGEQLMNGGSIKDGQSIQLGAFGAVSDMAIDTVDLLIRVLEDRKQELLVPTASSPANPTTSSSYRATRASSRRTSKKKKKSPFDEEQHTESSDESDVTASPPPLPAASTYPRTTVVRSRSYEALVQLEGILEARHQQLMRDGVLEPPAPPSSANSNATAGALTTEDDEAAATTPGGRVMTTIQQEIRKMHRSLRQERSSEGANYAAR